MLPFRVAGAAPALRQLREGMLDLLAAKLTGASRVVESRTALVAWRAAGGTETADLDAEAGAGLGARFGARDVLLGDVTSGDDGRIVLRASLLPTAGGEAREATAEGPRDSVSSLVDRLALRLLALRTGQDLGALGSLDGTPPVAIWDYLEGQGLLRRGDGRRRRHGAHVPAIPRAGG